MQNSQYKQSLHDRGICVIIPTYNNEGTIADVVERTLLQCDDVIVVNDGSTDQTGEILRNIPGINLVDYPDNAGKGSALKRGFKKAIELGYSYAITLDADGQHFPEDIPAFLEANIKNPGSLIIGQRQFNGAIRTKGSRFANSFSNFWFCVQTLHYLKDTQTGYRLYPLRHLHGLSFLTSRYEAELELLVFASWNGVNIVPIDVKVYYPPTEERVSHFRPGLDFTRISILNTILCVLAIVYALPYALLRLLYTIIYTIFSLMVYLIGALFIITPYTFFLKITRSNVANLHRLLNRFGKIVVKLLSMFGTKTRYINDDHETFKQPAVIICNHQSHLDLIFLLSLTPNIIFLTNDWVWNSPFFGYIVRNAQYYPVSSGIDNIMPKLQSLVSKGYSICVFPEGTRSVDCSIGRFHKGAFHIANNLNLDIIPIILYGAGHVLPKKGWYMRRWPIVLSIKNRIRPKALTSLGENERDWCKYFRRFYTAVYSTLSNEIEKNV